MGNLAQGAIRRPVLAAGGHYTIIDGKREGEGRGYSRWRQVLAPEAKGERPGANTRPPYFCIIGRGLHPELGDNLVLLEAQDAVLLAYFNEGRGGLVEVLLLVRRGEPETGGL
jgi:hypothetical protein